MGGDASCNDWKKGTTVPMTINVLNSGVVRMKIEQPSVDLSADVPKGTVVCRVTLRTQQGMGPRKLGIRGDGADMRDWVAEGANTALRIGMMEDNGWSVSEEKDVAVYNGELAAGDATPALTLVTKTEGGIPAGTYTIKLRATMWED
ncbi:hypothetical protein ECQG_04462 [Escherichia coli TA255]|nr:hypothetical protein ECQG_04462 [Escherichia coli TA255]